jgi:hypothetical protein
MLVLSKGVFSQVLFVTLITNNRKLFKYSSNISAGFGALFSLAFFMNSDEIIMVALTNIETPLTSD